MGRNRLKNIAEFQFNANAAPVNLGVNFKSLVDPELNQDLLECGEEKFSFPEIFQKTDESQLDIECESLIIIANDLNPQERDEFKNEIEKLPLEIKDLEIDTIDYDISDLFLENIESNGKIDSVDFKIAHSKVKSQIQFKTDDKISSAVQLVELAIDKMSEDEKKKFKLKESQQMFYSGRKLIDKSFESMEYVNKLGFRILNLLKFKYPNEFLEFPEDENDYVEWFNKRHKEHSLKSFMIMCAITATRLKTIDITLNNYCGIRMGFNAYGCVWTTHQILFFLNLRTVPVRSRRFYNFMKVVFNFSKVYGGKRLFYLEKICYKALNDDIFFRSDHHLFAEQINNRWKNEEFRDLSNCVDEFILRKLLLEDVHSI